MQIFALESPFASSRSSGEQFCGCIEDDALAWSMTAKRLANHRFCLRTPHLTRRFASILVCKNARVASTDATPKAVNDQAIQLFQSSDAFWEACAPRAPFEAAHRRSDH